MAWRFSFLLLLLLLILLLFNRGVECQEEPPPPPRNEVLGEPTVSCAADAIYVKLRTKSTFLGHVDVKYTPDKSCFQSLVTNNQIEILIPHEECMVPRRRSLRPTGVILEVSVSVSFHPEFTTADDRVFHMQCFHQKRSNGSSLSIGSPQPPPADSQGPSCSYEVLSRPGGSPAGRLTLGQSVFHSWQCHNVYESCIMIENCELVGGEEKHEVIDSSGCSKHESIMPQLEYHNRTHVGAEVKVFGVSNSPIVYFACQVRLHPQSPSGDCPKPKCDLSRRKKRESSESSFPSIDVRTQNLEISQLINATVSEPPVPPVPEHATCPEIHVESSEVQNADVNESKLSEEAEERICADFRLILVASILLTMIVILVTTSIVVLIFRRQKYEIASMS